MEKKTILFLVWLVMNYVDFFVTVYALNIGGFYEHNPLYHLNPIIFNVVKLIFVPLLVYILYRKTNEKVLYACIIIYAILLANNFYWLATTTS